MDKERDYFQEDGDIQKIIGRFENMLNHVEACFFDVYEFERIIDHYLDSNHFTKAIDAVRVGRNQHPASTSLRIKEAQVYAEKGESLKALGMLENLERTTEANNEIFMLKGMVLNQLGRITEAEKAFGRAVDLSYENTDDVLYDIALSFQYVNQYKSALKYLKKAHETNPGKLNILYDLAYCYDRLHDFDHSISC
jgi:tetratricopeptide (TPR) repeat protein